MRKLHEIIIQRRILLQKLEETIGAKVYQVFTINQEQVEKVNWHLNTMKVLSI